MFHLSPPASSPPYSPGYTPAEEAYSPPASNTSSPARGGRSTKQASTRAPSVSAQSRQSSQVPGGAGDDGVLQAGEDDDDDNLENEDELEDAAEPELPADGSRKRKGINGEDERDEEELRWEAVKRRTQRVKADQRFLIEHLDPDQQARFNAWKTASFPKPGIKKFVRDNTITAVSDDLCQILGGVSKVYVGLIVAQARKVQESRGEDGPLTPDHLREAHRLYVLETKQKGEGRARPGAGKTRNPFVK